ncbi:DotI/IcmL family type IV secretion protein [Fastidiosibacter lacustris]|uniref:DotI/IcmL family type IV secretion protein n=1 Tax=Fastidiosibacter lacustris TaxID=2056695 RepID=UPI000E34D0E7|nr:DotI/IcmL family type IV secretion protein [Fastidiosibacter lacustris]
MQANVLKAITEKAEFYKNNFRLMIKILLVSVLLNLVLLLGLWYSHKEEKIYFLAIDNQGVVKELNLPQTPVVTEDMLINWVSQNVNKLYKFDFLNYKEQILALRPLFTDHGWQAFNEAFKDTIKQVVDQKMVAKAVLNGVPVVTAVGYIAGIKSWQVQVPILVTFSKGHEAGNNNMILKLTLQENTDISDLASGQYFGITQIIQLNEK